MGYNDESLSTKINRFASAIGSTASSIYESKAQKGIRMQEITLQRAKYLDNLDSNVYSASSQKALKGIESLFYGNSKTGTNGFFKDQLNGMDYELYQQNTDAMIAETLSVEYLSKNYGMTESHAQRFIDEYGSTITAEANQRTQTNTFISMQSQLGSDMEAFATLQANGGTSAMDQYQNLVKHYNDVGGSSWDITGTYNPEKLENRLSFGYSWSVSASKRVVDANIANTGITTEQIVENAMSIYDASMAELGDGSAFSEATIVGNREQFEESIRSYITMRAGQMYTESQDKARMASNALAQISLEGGYVDAVKLDEVLSDSGLSESNVYDLSFILDFKNNIQSQSSAYGSASGGRQQGGLAVSNYYATIFEDPSKSNEDCFSAIAMMQCNQEITVSEATALYKEAESRTTFVTKNAEYAIDTLIDHLSMSLGTDAEPLILSISKEPNIRSQIHKTLASHPEWKADKVYDYAVGISLSMQDKSFAKSLDKMMEFEFGKATGYSTEYNIAEEDATVIREKIYSGEYSYLLRPSESDYIMSAMYNGLFSSEDELKKALSLRMFQKEYDDLDGYEKSVVEANVLVNGVRAKDFKTITGVLGEIDQLRNEDNEYSMAEIYGYGIGAVSKNNVYFISNDGYLYTRTMEYGDSNWESVHNSDKSYGVVIDPSILKGNGRISLDDKPAQSEENKKANPFGPMMQDVALKLSEEPEQTLASKMQSAGKPKSLDDISLPIPEMSEEKKIEASKLLTAIEASNTQSVNRRRPSYESK